MRLISLLASISLLNADFNSEISFRTDYRYHYNDFIQRKIATKMDFEKSILNYNINITGRGYYDIDKTGYNDLWLERFTIDKDYSNFSFSIGKNQVTWGESDYFKVVNIINPINLSDYYLSYIEDYKSATISLNMLNLEYSFEEWTSSFLFIPDFEENKSPHPQMGFYNKEIEAYQSIKTKYPKKFAIEDSSYGFNLNRSVDDYDFGLYFYYGWNFTPIVISPSEKKIFRRKMLGLSLSKNIGNFIFRTDNTIYINEMIQSKNFSIEKSDVIKNLIGIDWSHDEDSVSFQFLNTYICSKNFKIKDKRDKREISLFLQKDTNNNNLILSSLLLYNFDTKVGLNEYKIKYRYNEDTNLFFGYDLFMGEDEMLSGYIKENRFFTKIEYFF